MDNFHRDRVEFRYNIQAAVLKFLYAPVDARHEKQLETLIVRNSLLMKTGTRAFRYKGELYRSSMQLRGPVLAPRLHAEVEADMELMLQEKEEIQKVELPLVNGFITKVLNQSLNIDDYLLLLPDCIHQPIRALNLISIGPRAYPTEAHAVTFLHEHSRQRQLIRERMATNLLFQL